MARYWVSWWTTNTMNAGCSKPPFDYWCTGQREAREDPAFPEYAMCALVEEYSVGAVWGLVERCFPDCEQRFCDLKPNGWEPGDRFLPTSGG